VLDDNDMPIMKWCPNSDAVKNTGRKYRTPVDSDAVSSFLSMPAVLAAMT